MKKIISMLLAALLIATAFTSLPITASAATAGDPLENLSGSVGNCTWDFAESTGVLTVFGNGAMPDFSVVYDDNTNSWTSTSIPWWSVQDQITSVVIGNGITKIGNYAFFGCGGLTEVTFGSGVRTIGTEAFRNCGLQSLTLNDGLQTIMDKAFLNNRSLRSATVPESVTSIGDVALGIYISGGADDWEYMVVRGFTIYGVRGSAAETYASYFNEEMTFSEIQLSGTTGACTWTLDPHGAFFVTGNGAMANYSSASDAPWYIYRDRINYVFIGDGVTRIGSNAFNSSAVMQVQIPGSVEVIGYSSFYDCKSLSRVDMEEGITTIGNSAFYGCDLGEIEIPEGVETISNYAFCYCDMYEAELPESLLTIGEYAFFSNELSEITLPDGLQTIGASAFRNNSYLHSVTVPASVTSIGSRALGYIGNNVDSSYKIYGYTGTVAETYANDNNITFIRAVKKYNIWLGSTQVTEDNADDIIGDNLSWYDEDDNTLYILSSEIPGTASVSGIDCKIFTTVPNLRIWGSYHMSSAETSAGLFASGNVTLQGGFTFIGSDFGIRSTGKVTFDSGASVCTGGDYGINSVGNIVVTNGAESVTFNGPVYTRTGITLGDRIHLTVPENGIITDGTVMNTVGTTADRVVFERQTVIISSLDITDVTEPAAGQYPEYTAFGADGCYLMINWYDADTDDLLSGSFEDGHQYYIKINAEANEGYALAENLTATVNGDSAQVLPHDSLDYDRGCTVKYVFPRIEPLEHGDEPITWFNITHISNPYAGQSWNYKACVPSTMTLNSVKLFDSSGNEVSRGTALIGDKTYWAEITVTAREGYCFEYTVDNGWKVYPHVFFDSGSAWGYPVDTPESQSGTNGTSKTVSLRWRMVPATEIPMITGDSDADGYIDVTDATTIQKHIAGVITLTGDRLTAADADGNGIIDVNDVTAIQKYAAKHTYLLG